MTPDAVDVLGKECPNQDSACGEVLTNHTVCDLYSFLNGTRRSVKRYQRNDRKVRALGVGEAPGGCHVTIHSYGQPATVELDLMPINPDWILEGAQRARAKALASSQDGTIWIMA